jgi:enterochelin esterase-like enzyme
MKKFIALFMLTAISAGLVAQSGKISDNLNMESKILKGERSYAVYLPPDYETSDRSYPVLYLLHGGGDDQTGWVQFGEVKYIADKEILEGRCTPMIIVMPDANTGKRGYFNSADGKWRYEDFFFEEFIPYIESTYRIKAVKRYRSVAGLSMGGGGSFMYALHHPEMFAAACPLSASTGPLTIEDARRRLTRYGQDFSEKQLEEYFLNHSALELIKTMPLEDVKAVKWYIDCGDDDFLYEGNSLIHIEMRKKEIPHQFRVRDGAHRWEYWRESLPKVLQFASGSYRQDH